MIRVGDIVKIELIDGACIGKVIKLESHRGFQLAEVMNVDGNFPRFIPRWLEISELYKMSDAELMIWKLENA